MAAPTYIGAGTGLALTTGTGTVSKTSCTAGNLIAIHFRVRGHTEDWGNSNVVNITSIAGVANDVTDVVISEGGVWLGRATTSATCSMDLTVGASSEDIFARIYEFSGVATSSTLASIIENDIYTFDSFSGSVSPVDDINVATNGADRLALNFVALNNNQNIPNFTGMTGGTWGELTEFSSATGLTATLQLQSAAMPSSGVVGGGSATITDTIWLNYGFALIPAASGTPGTGSRMMTLGAG